MTKTSHQLLELAANTVRGLSADAVQKANSGHPGMPMGTADLACVLWLEYLRWTPSDPEWLGRDRFVLSAGHGSMLLYSMLHFCGYDVSLDDIKNFRQLHSKTPGHPEFGETPGVETTTGPLGQGFGNGVGMALGAKMEAARFGCDQLETRVFGIVSDGDLMEGVAHEAASMAGHLGLSNLVYLYDDNRITIDGETDITYTEDVALRFESLGWRVLRADGHNADEIRAGLDAAIAESEKPSLIICRTHIGQGSPNKVDSSASHGAPLGDDEVRLTKEGLGLPTDEFHVPQDVLTAFADRRAENESERERWNAELEEWRKANPETAMIHRGFRNREVPANLLDELVAAAGSDKAATRAISGAVIQRAAELVPSHVGGSADLEGSTKTRIKNSGNVQRGAFGERNIAFGIREHAMGAVMNGLALHGGYLPQGSTFLVFSDYMRPSIRLAALMGLPCAFVYTHDSLMVGEDGPTHQPIEHVAALRLIPNLHVFRPADGPEVAAAWTHALSRRDGPVAMALTRQGIPPLSREADFEPAAVFRGGYAVSQPAGATATLVATGAEVHIAAEAAAILAAEGLVIRVVSMPCLELFMAQDEAYRSQVLGNGPVLALEMGRPEIWCQVTGRLEHVIGIQRFGASGPAVDVAAHFGFTPGAVAARVRQILGS